MQADMADKIKFHMKEYNIEPGWINFEITETAADFVNSFVGGDNKFMRTCIDLFTRPGYMVHDYLLGKRVTAQRNC